MTVPSFTKDLDGILCIAGVVAGTPFSNLIAPDGSGQFVQVDPNGIVSYTTNGGGTYAQAVVSADGQKASFMPMRSGGPQPGARWWNYALITVPTTGL